MKSGSIFGDAGDFSFSVVSQECKK
jgi:hypothetical protein